MKKIKILFFLSLLIAQGCTKDRKPEFPDGQGLDLVDKSEIINTEASIKLGQTSQESKSVNTESIKLDEQITKLSVVSFDGPSKLAPMFKDLQTTGRPGGSYKVKFELNRKYITAFKIVSKSEEVSSYEDEVSKIVGEEKWVPMMSYPVKGYGVVTKQKNELKEETATLRFQGTELDEASHVQISTLLADRILITPPESDKKELFLASKLDGSLIKAGDLVKVGLNIRPDLDNDALIYIKLDHKGLHLYTIVQSEKLAPGEFQRIKQLASGIYKECPKELNQKINLKLNNNGTCVLRESYRVSVEYIKPKREVKDGLEMPSVIFETSSFKETNVVRIKAQPTVEMILDDSTSRMINLGTLVKVSDLKDKKFTFAITLEDSPNMFEHVFAGLAGDLEIVRVEFLKDSVQIIRDRPIRKVKAATEVDREVMASFPVQYVVRIVKDAQGMPMQQPRYESVNYTHPEALAEIQWDSNRIANVNSPLNYYSVERCFDGRQSRHVSAFENNLTTDKFLALSLDSVYLASRSKDCVGLGALGYFDRGQSSFTFRERYTLKEYISKSETDEAPIINIPFAAQKKFGFGLFTYKLEKPNASDQVGLDGTEVALPAVFDIRNGKSINYVLAGIPEASELRSKIIRSTAEVIRDLNLGFKRSLDGTPMERKDSIIKLYVQDATQAELDQVRNEFKIEDRILVSDRSGKLGDIDRNYIWYVGKTTKSSVIGLGGAQVNPRSGIVESGSVYIYGGNITGYAEYLKRQKKFHDLYASQAQIIDLPKVITEKSGNGVKVGDLESTNERKEISRLHVAPALVKKSIDTGLVRDSGPVRNKRLFDNISGLLGRMDPLSRSFFEATAEAQRQGNIGSLETILNQYRDRKIENIIANVSDIKSASLLGKLNKEKATQEIMNRLGHSCAFTTDSVSVDSAVETLKKENGLTELIVGIYKSTLAHEIGHNLGLRHNFIASFDQANWKFDKFDESLRNYSSVMDYIPNHHTTYEGEDKKYGGLGPQDVHSLRAAYSGLIELDPKLVEDKDFDKMTVKNDNGELFLANDKNEPVIQIYGNDSVGFRYISLEDIRSKVFGMPSWTAISRMPKENIISNIPIKTYEFCSDEDASGTPVCSRHDIGSTPLEIVENYVKEYKAMYAYRNIVNDRIDFSLEDDGAYVSRVISTFIPIRKMLDETIYQYVKGDRDNVGIYLQAAQRAMMFFHEVIQTPDAESMSALSNRFAKIVINEKIVPVERKFLKSFGTDIDSDQIWVRGIELDKAFALIMLTTRELGIPRYEQASIRVSFPLFEKIAGLSPKDGNPDDAPTLSLIRSILDDHLRPAVMVPSLKGYYSLPTILSSDVSEIMRMYAIIGSIVNQDVSGLEVNDNLSRLFRVMNSSKQPDGTLSVVEPGLSFGEKGAIYYFAHDSSTASKKLVARVDSIDKLLKQKKNLVDLFKKYESKDSDIKKLAADATVEEKTKLEEELKFFQVSFETTLASFPDTIGLKKITDLVKVRTAMLDKLMTLEAAEQAGKIDPDTLDAQLSFLKTDFSQKIKLSPSLEIAMEALDPTTLQSNYFEAVAPVSQSEQRRGVVFRNIQLLNQLFYSIHPEYRN